jgi:hypothetical protein
MRIAIRNTGADQRAADEVGSATEFVEVPDRRKNIFVLSGIQLKLDGAQIPDGIGTGTEGKTFEMSYRAPVMGDPAVRQFHAGDSMAYGTQLFAGRDVRWSATLQTVSEGKPVESEAIELRGQEISGVYHINSDAAPGHYFLGIKAEELHGKKVGRTTNQWIDFEVVR